MARLRRRIPVLTLAIILAMLTFGMFGGVAGATGPIITTPDPIIVHTGPGGRVPFGTSVDVVFNIPIVNPNGWIAANVTNGLPLGPIKCRATTQIVPCKVYIPSLPAGVYTFTSRYIGLYGGSATGTITVIVLTP